jgi:CHASE3 domain sensor protein
MPDQSSIKKFADSTVLRQFPRHAGAAVALFGLLVIASWYAHWQSVLQMLPNTAPMQFNTALCFILSGAGLFLLTTRWAVQARWPGGAVLVFTLLTLLEYLAGRDFGIDQFFFKPWLQADTVYPGRMSPLAAVCFILTGSGIVLASLKGNWPQRLTAAGIFACIVGVVALVALFGFLLGIQSAYGWGSYSRMAFNTAVAFLILGGGLLAWSMQTARLENFNFLRWMPVTGSVTLMVMIAFVSAVNLEELRNATFWRKHTIEVILDAQAFQDNFTALQLGVRGYVTLGDTNALASYQNSLQLEPEQFNQLVGLTSDNPAQREALKDLSATMADVFAYDKKMLALYRRQGFAGVSKNDATGEGRKVFGNTINAINKFTAGEQKLLDARSTSEEADSDNAAHLLVFGSMLAALLLVLANGMASHELTQRRRAEIEREKLIGQLQLALAEVKTLSGMIPICGWCKSVRNDKGYWSSVEHYVRTHTDATFSHGMCPDCAEKFKADILKSSLKQGN